MRNHREGTSSSVIQVLNSYAVDSKEIYLLIRCPCRGRTSSYPAPFTEQLSAEVIQLQ